MLCIPYFLLSLLSYTMKKEQVVRTQQQMQKYYQQNQLRGLFHELTKQILLHRPSDPLQYLTNYLSTRNNLFHIISIYSTHHEHRAKVSALLERRLNFVLIQLNTILKNAYPIAHIKDYNSLSDASIHNAVTEAIQKQCAANPSKKGIILSGYPNNLKQLDLLQKSAFLPQRYFFLKQTHPQGTTQQAILRDSLEKKQLLQGLNDNYDEVDNEEHILDAMSIRCRAIVPKQSLCLVVLHPPYLRPKSLFPLVRKYCLHHVSLTSTYRRAMCKEQFKKYVEGMGLTREIQLALIETACKSPAGRNKGVVISGWPRNKDWAELLPKTHLIFIFTTIKDKIFEEYNKLSDQSEVFAIENKPSLEEYEGMWKEYQGLVDQMKQKSNAQVLPMGESEQQVYKTFQSLIQNSKVYS